MTWRTHVAGGVASLWLLKPFLAHGTATGAFAAPASTNLGLLALVAGFGALLPDLDARESAAKHLSFGLTFGANRLRVAPLHLPAVLLHRAFGHRGPLHSLWGFVTFAFVAGAPMAWYTSPSAVVALLLGWASHLILDACTKSGVPLLWPGKRRLHFLPPGLRITTGSDAEGLAFAPLATAAFALLLSALPVTQSP